LNQNDQKKPFFENRFQQDLAGVKKVFLKKGQALAAELWNIGSGTLGA
jgi:hypothetical protein